ncbi:integrase and RNaseH domain-containing protein [Golovinomyces cichoracearum]|uniref:Integrase and RNaseH domain-containing protein n=1 Tax=Golovinomyces cichoracearum TaxID=62708 RepID=A0A420J627_9PEZI|nr:integrase and RNaseH domain-containing protein [Golovinomyces cichoracearum]
MLKGSAREYYHLNLTVDEMTTRLEAHFETAECQEQMLSKWKNLSLQRLIEEIPTISYAECLEILDRDLRRTQLSLPSRYQGDESLRDTIVDAVRDVRECSSACDNASATFEALCADIRASTATEDRLSKTKLTHQNRPQGRTMSDQIYTDRYYKELRSKSSPRNFDTRKYPK